jgi:hypothetical protein
VKPAVFEELLESVRQMGEIRRGTLKPGRVTKFKPVDVKALRSRLGRANGVSADDRRERGDPSSGRL